MLKKISDVKFAIINSVILSPSTKFYARNSPGVING